MGNRNYGKVLGSLEKEIMEIVWQSNDPITVKDVHEILKRNRTIAYTTVMTIMGRLTEKGILTQKRNDISYSYQSKVSRENFVSKSVHNIFTSTVSFLGQEAVTYFVKEIKKINPKKRQELLKMLDEK